MSRKEAENLLRVAVGNPSASFREDQWEAIDRLVNHRSKLLLVQRTGWGKSCVYFMSVKILRERQLGPTIIISPLLALMNNQIEAAKRFNLVAATLNSTNEDQKEIITRQVLNNEIDCLLISPEKLANEQFNSTILQPLASKIALIVIDEAHCISTWGHDFRPDYRRIITIMKLLPENIPVLATTATATKQVIKDLRVQLGNLQIIRGSLFRESLSLQTLNLPDPASRLAWLAKNIPNLPGSGIVYALTIRDANLVTKWLNFNNIKAKAYHGSLDNCLTPQGLTVRQELENDLLANKLKVLVATSALGMGFDKPDLGFVIHYRAPESVIAYYQQVGRAGRGIDKAVGVLMMGSDDESTHDYFRNSAYPSVTDMRKVLSALSNNYGLSSYQIRECVNLPEKQIQKVLKFLLVENPAHVKKHGQLWLRTSNSHAVEHFLIEGITERRREDWAQLLRYMEHKGCKMQFLQKELDDPEEDPAACGKCDSCDVDHAIGELDDEDLVRSAENFIKNPVVTFDVSKYVLFVDHRAEPGRALSRWGDNGWFRRVKCEKEAGHFSDELVDAIADMILNRWAPTPFPSWVCCVPSLRHPTLVPSFARRLASKLELPFYDAVRIIRDTEPQKFQKNSSHQFSNTSGVFKITQVDPGPVLLVDDIVDSGATFCEIAGELRRANSGLVYPVALASLRDN